MQQQINTFMIKTLFVSGAFLFLFTNSDCKKNTSCTTCPSPILADTLITTERELADGEQPAVSPDGSKIAFSRNGDIWVMDTSGANQNQLTFGGDTDIMPRWQPDGQTIGFLRKHPTENNKSLIFSVPVSGGTVTQRIYNLYVAEYWLLTGMGNTNPIWDWSPDGKYIAFISYSDNYGYLNIVLSDQDSTIYSELIYNGAGSLTSCFAWSLNSNEIVFLNQVTKSLTLKEEFWKVNFVTDEIKKDTSYNLFPGQICRSPIANKFAHTSNPIGSSLIIVTDFSNRLNEFITVSRGGLKWSSDEKYFMYYYPDIVNGGDVNEYTRSLINIYSLERKNID